MLNFPQSTIFGRKIPKDKFYANLDVTQSIKQHFVSDIDLIIWQNKLSTTTLNVDVGSKVIEIDILVVTLKVKAFDFKLLEFIDKNVPHHTVFILSFGSESQLVINYKEAIENREGKFKIIATYKSEWIPKTELTLSIDGLNLDKIYGSFISQISNGKIKTNEAVDIKQAIDKAKEIDNIKAQINVLEVKIAKEKQFNVQIRLSSELKIIMDKFHTLKG